MRYPSYPLIAHDPYFSIWSPSDNLNDSWTKHWTGANHEICGIIRIDGKPYCYLGNPRGFDKLPQTSVTVLPTRTIYTFEADGVKLTLTFLTPALPQKLDILSRPVTYICYNVASIDGKPHDAQVYIDFGSEICVNDAQDPTLGGRFQIATMNLLGFTSARPNMLGRVGDNLRIEWGYFYLGLPKTAEFTSTLGGRDEMRNAFRDNGKLPADDRLESCNPYRRPRIIAAAAATTLNIAANVSANFHVVAAYDDIFSVEYLNQRLVAYWRRDGLPFSAMLNAAETELPQIVVECEAFDKKLLGDAEKVGGKDYADLCAIAYRQSIAAHKLVAATDGTPYFFSKENFSNGCICTVDVTYPSAPLYLLVQPALLKGMLIPILNYAELKRWPFSFAPHDLGTYPLANGQVYGGGEKNETNQMPVEESGNLLILAGALVKFENDVEFASKYWNTFSKWAEYLLAKGYDPENQLCTDDFAGHLAHNTNLSLKAIMGLGAYAQIAKVLGKNDIAEKYLAAAKDAANRWQKDALDENGAYRLAFDQPGTWSQKYNLVWDKLLGLNLFSDDVAKRELAHYRKIQGEYGLPLDNRRTYTKIDWILWSATLTRNDDDFAAILAPVMKFLQNTPDRIPLTDWYETTDARKVGFQARSVVGGIFLKLLYDENFRKSYRI